MHELHTLILLCFLVWFVCLYVGTMEVPKKKVAKSFNVVAFFNWPCFLVCMIVYCVLCIVLCIVYCVLCIVYCVLCMLLVLGVLWRARDYSDPPFTLKRPLFPPNFS